MGRSRKMRGARAALVALLGGAAMAAGCGGADDTDGSNFRNPQADASTADGGGGGSTGGFGTNDSGFDPTKPLGDAACVGSTQNGEIAAADLLLVVDKSYSTDFPNVGSKWFAIKSALKSFVSNPKFDGLGVGLQYLPLPLTCDVASYAKPAVELDVLPTVAPEIEASLELQRPSGGTPMAPAMRGALTYAQARAAANPRRKVVIVLATDGIPDDLCSGYPNTIDKVVEIATAGRGGTPKIPTFVIAVGAELTPLKAIAVAGGTGDAIVVDTNGDVEQQFLGALQQVRKLAIGCDYAIPSPPPGATLDFAKINVQFAADANAASETLGYAANEAACGTNPRGWRYDDPSNPTKVILCPQICSEALAADNPKVEVVLGCTTIVK